MGKINILPAKVFNRIAAGEVVERPCSAVKELVENSIDAGATEIEIYIENGGKDLIRVVDNGCGIEREDLQSAFLPHATSKLATVDDLNEIMTLGFRGEAVASIASVSKMTITSKVKDGKCYALTSNGGELGVISPASGNDGTDVCVERLFFNAPARAKFLKKDKTEETEITNYVSRFILSRPDVAFTYYVDGKKILQSFGTGDEEAFLSVYGVSAYSQCIRIDGEKNGIRVYGYMGNYNYVKPNKSYINVFINGRYVLNTTIISAVINSYASYLMKRQFPFCVLHVNLPPQIVDVNVHPNKTDVRFMDNGVVYHSVYSILSSVLDGNATAMKYVEQPKNEEVFPATEEKEPQRSNSGLPKEVQERIEAVKRSISEGILAKSTQPKKSEKDLKERVFDFEEKPAKTFGFASFTYEDAQKEIQQSQEVVKESLKEQQAIREKKGYTSLDEIPDINPKLLTKAKRGRRKVSKKISGSGKLRRMFPGLPVGKQKLIFHDTEYEQQTQNEDSFLANKRYLEELELKATQDKIDVSSCVYQGKLFNTYLLYECGNDVYIIDQHAAHERLIYNRLRQKIRDRSVARQPMLLPYELTLNASESAFIREHISEISDMGFDIEEINTNSFAVSAIPVDLPRIDVEAFFNLVLSDIDGYRAIKIDDVLKDKLASTACKAAVKGGMDLTKDEALELLKQMDGDMSLKCPHGRPVVIKLTRTDLEKLFKRIV